MPSRRRKGSPEGLKLGLFLLRFWIKLLMLNNFVALFPSKISPFSVIFPHCLVAALSDLFINSSLTSWYCQGEVAQGRLRRGGCASQWANSLQRQRPNWPTTGESGRNAFTAYVQGRPSGGHRQTAQRLVRRSVCPPLECYAGWLRSPSTSQNCYRRDWCRRRCLPSTASDR